MRYRTPTARRTWLVLTTLAALCVSPPVAGAATQRSGPSVHPAPDGAAVHRAAAHKASGDFNGDGFSDLAVGVPGEGPLEEEGAVQVLYGSPTGLRAAHNQLWRQDSPGVPGTGAGGHLFGRSLATGDLDGDGFADLAVESLEEAAGQPEAGEVTILYGSSTGLTSAGSTVVTRQFVGTAGFPDHFGWSLAAGDVGKGPEADLIAGVPGADLVGATDAGAFDVFYGSPTGLSQLSMEEWNLDSPSVAGVAGADDELGSAVATGSLGKTSQLDVVVGAPTRVVGTTMEAGAVLAMYGTPAGLTAIGSRLLDETTPGVPGVPRQGGHFGDAVRAGSFGRSPQADVAIGAPDETVGSVSGAGSVTVLYGSSTGLRTTNAQRFTQATPGVAGVPSPADEFGFSLAAGNVGGSAFADLVVGVQFDTLGSKKNVGSVAVLYGSPTGLVVAGNQLFTQDSPGVPGVAKEVEQLGAAVSVGQFGRGGPSDVAAGVPFDILPGKSYVGAVNVLYGTSAGLSATGSQLWNQDSPGILSTAKKDEQFGDALTPARG